MNKATIIRKIKDSHQEVYTWLEKHGKKNWLSAPVNKWNSGQIILHLVQSEKPLIKALRLPKFILAYKFGRANRPSRTETEVIDKYHSKLASAGTVVSPFSQKMDIPTVENRHLLIDQFKKTERNLIRVLENKWSEKDLDTYIVPHPLMGRMTIREITGWTSYHSLHHLIQLKERIIQD